MVVAVAVSWRMLIVQVWRSVIGKMPVFDVKLTIKNGSQLTELVQNQKERDPGFFGRLSDLSQAHAGARVNTGHRLIHDEKIRGTHQSARNEDALLLAAGENRHGIVYAMRQPYAVESLQCPAAI